MARSGQDSAKGLKRRRRVYYGTARVRKKLPSARS